MVFIYKRVNTNLYHCPHKNGSDGKDYVVLPREQDKGGIGDKTRGDTPLK